MDSSFWIALRNADDEFHAKARNAAADLLAQRRRWVVTGYIFAEVHARFARSPRLREQIIHDFWDNPVIHHEPIDHSTQLEAVAMLRRHADKAWSFCDALSFVVMEKLSLDLSASFDMHFRQFGRCAVVP